MKPSELQHKIKSEHGRWLCNNEFSVKVTGAKHFPQRSMFGRVAEIKVVIRDRTGIEAAHFKMAAMPNCYSALISGDNWVNPLYRRKGIATYLHKFKKTIAEASRAGIMICTTVYFNDPQRALLKKTGWANLADFTSPITHKVLCVYTKVLAPSHQKGPEDEVARLRQEHVHSTLAIYHRFAQVQWALKSIKSVKDPLSLVRSAQALLADAMKDLRSITKGEL